MARIALNRSPRGSSSPSPTGTPKLLGTRQKFAQHGGGGAWLSEALPNLAGVADDLTIIKSVWTEQFNHGPASCCCIRFPAGAGARVAWLVGDVRARLREP